MSEIQQIQVHELEMEPAKLINLLELSALSGGGKPAIETLRLSFSKDGVLVNGMESTRVTGVIGKFNPKYFVKFDETTPTVDISVQGLLERVKKSFKTDQKIKISITKDRILIEGKTETYDEMLPANINAPYKPNILQLGQRGYELQTAKPLTQMKIDGGELKDLDAEKVKFTLNEKEISVEIKSDISSYRRTIKAKETSNSDAKGSVEVQGERLKEVASKLNTEVWVTFTEGPGPTLFSVLPADYVITYFIAPKV